MSIHRDSEAYAGLSSDSQDRDFIAINRQISRSLHADLSAAIAENKKHDKCAVILTTLGGDPHAGYRIARCLRHSYKEVRLLVPSVCKSAGTLVAIGANDLRIGDLGELGPLDIQVIKPAETIERGSGLDVTTALQQCVQHATSVFFSFFRNARSTLNLSPRLAGEMASGITAGLLAPLYSQIDPLRLGEMQRAMAITLQYGQRLDKHCGNLKPGALNRLTIDYPAHEFVIDRKEARDLFQNVSALSDKEALACKKLWGILGYPSEHGPFFILPDVPPGESNGPESIPLPTGIPAPAVSGPSSAGKVGPKASRKRAGAS